MLYSLNDTINVYITLTEFCKDILEMVLPPFLCVGAEFCRAMYGFYKGNELTLFPIATFY